MIELFLKSSKHRSHGSATTKGDRSLHQKSTLRVLGSECLAVRLDPILIGCTPSPAPLVVGRSVEPVTKFLKKGDLTESQFLER